MINENKDLVFDPELNSIHYKAGLDDYLIEETEYRSIFSHIGDQEIWYEHTTNECIISFCGGRARAWEEVKAELE